MKGAKGEGGGRYRFQTLVHRHYGKLNLFSQQSIHITTATLAKCFCKILRAILEIPFLKSSS
jgi:hypothetical protein